MANSTRYSCLFYCCIEVVSEVALRRSINAGAFVSETDMTSNCKSYP